MNGPAFALRAVRVDDAPALGHLHATCWHESYAGLVPEAMLAAETIQTRTALWTSILGAGDAAPTRVLVAECLGEMVGFGAHGSQRTDELASLGYDGEISALYVRGAMQGRGIGRALFRALAGDLATRGFRGVALWVLRDNRLGRAFYDRAGGVIVASREEQRDGAILQEVAYGWTRLTKP